MSKKLAVFFTVLTIVSMLLVPVAFADTAEITSISLSPNKTIYIDEKADGTELKALGRTDSGELIDISDKMDSYTSSDPEIFRIQGKKLYSTGKTGRAIITGAYKGTKVMYGKIVMMTQNSATEEGYKIAPEAYVDNATKEDYITTGEPGTPEGGHFDGNALSNWGTGTTTVRMYRKSWTSGGDKTKINKSDTTLRWFENGYRSFTGWFYDNGDESVRQGFSWVTFSDSDLFHTNFAKDYGYGKFADKWADKRSWCAFKGTVLYGDGKEYKDGTKFGNRWSGFRYRTTGWHQIVVSLEKNEAAEYGWSVYTYLDGEPVGVVDIVPETSDTATAAGADCNDWATIEMRPSNSGKDFLDEMIIMGSLEKEDTSKTLTGAIGEGGSVTVNGAVFANGAAVKLQEDDAINIAVTPNAGYEVDKVMLGNAELVLGTSGEVAAKMPGEDVTLTVTFKAKSVTAPVIITDSSNNYFKTVDGKPTAFVYAKISDYSDPAFVGGYGMKLWIDGDAEHFITLPAMADETSEAVAAPNTAFAIRVYGNAITADNTYVFKPYIGETEGDEVKVAFAE